MEAELQPTHTLCGNLSHHESNKGIFWKKPHLLNDDQEMLNSNVSEGLNEAADMQLHQNIDDLQIVPEGKWFLLHSPCTKDSKVKINKNCLEEKQLMYNGLAGDLISNRLHQDFLYKKKRCNTNGCLSQPIQPSFNEMPFSDKSDLIPLPISKFHRKNMLFEDVNNSLVFPATNSHGLKKQAPVEKVSQFEDRNGNCYDVVRDEPGIEERTVPESYMNITTDKANSLAQNNKTDITQEVPEMYSYSPEFNEKWKNIQRFIKEQQLIYNGSAGDLISSTHWSNISKGMKNNIFESLSQPRASPNEDFIHMCTSERIISPKTAKIIDDKVKIAVNIGISKINHIYDECSAINDAVGSKETATQYIITGLIQTKSTDAEIQSEMHKVISTVPKNENSFDSGSSECSSGTKRKWKDIEKYTKEPYCIYSGFAGELISSTSGICVRTACMRQAALRSLSQPTEHVENNFIKEAISEGKSNLKISRDLPLSLQSSTCNTITEHEVMLSNTAIAEEIKLTASLKSPQNTKLKDVHINNTMQSCDMLNISTEYPLIDIHSFKVLQEQLDQTVPNKENTVDNEIDECSCIMNNTDPLQDASNNFECKRLSPDVFADRDDDISLYVRTAKDTPIYKLSQNVPEPLKANENDETNDFIRRVEKKYDSASFEDESLMEDADCLYASDMFPICLTQPAVPTYLLTNSNSEIYNNNPKVLETGTKTLERCPEQCFQEKIEKTIDSIDTASSENEDTCEISCKSTMSKISLCSTSTSSISLCHQNSVILSSDANFETSPQKISFSVSSNCDATFEKNLNFQIIPQKDKMDLNDQLHKTNICGTELKETNAKNRQSCNKSVHSNADENSDTQVHLSPTLENSQKAAPQNLKDCVSPASKDKYQQTQGIENLLVSEGDVLFIAKTSNKLDSCTTSVVWQNISIIKKQKLAEKTDTVDLICKPSNDTQSNQIIPVNNLSRSENCMNAPEQLHSNNTVLTQGTIVDENKCYSINNYPGLSQHSPPNRIYLDVAQNLCHKYSLNSAKRLKSQTSFKDIKAENHHVMNSSTDSSCEEYDSDASISEVTSESNIDLHIDAAIEKYQNASSGSEKSCTQGKESMVNSTEVCVQTDIFGLVQVKHCICKKFHLYCNFCNENLPEESESKEKKRQTISSDSEMPLNKKAKCYSQEMQMMNCSDTEETENKMQVTENIKYTENIKTLSQVYFNKSITPPKPVIQDYYYRSENKNNQCDVQEKYQHTQTLPWYKKSESSQKSREVNEQETPNKGKSRLPILRIGLSKRAKTKRLHYSSH